MTRPTKAPNTKTPDTIEAAARLRLVVARIHRLLRQQTTGGLGLAELSCMALINRRGPLPLGEIASRENLSAPTVTKTIVRLERRGYIDRLNDPADRRVSLISLSPKGRALVEDVKSRRTAYLNKRLQELEASEISTLLKALPILEALANEESEDHPG